MYVYNHTGVRGYEILNTVGRESSEIFAYLNGTPRTEKWIPPRVCRDRPSLREGFRPSDSPYRIGHVLVFRRSAVDALRDMLDAHGELLPVEDEGGVELYAYNPRALEALDHERSDGSRDASGRIELVNCHVFFPDVVRGVDIFRQARKRNAWIFFSERFLQRWKQAKLKGLDFTLVWDSELPPDQQPNQWLAKPVKL
jgi:hypothetical protein